MPNLLDLVADNIEVDGIVLLSEFDADYVVGSWSVPWRTGVTYADVSGKPYFAAEPLKLPKRGKLNVGLVWRGNPAYGMDVHRSMPFAGYAPLFDLPGVAFHSLPRPGRLLWRSLELGYDGFVANLEPFCNDWRATARVIQSLDVVVSVDTACAHLARRFGQTRLHPHDLRLGLAMDRHRANGLVRLRPCHPAATQRPLVDVRPPRPLRAKENIWMSDDRLLDARNRAVRAQALVDDPLLKRALTRWKPPISRHGAQRRPEDQNAREALPCGQCHWKAEGIYGRSLRMVRIADVELHALTQKKSAASSSAIIKDNTWTDRCSLLRARGRGEVAWTHTAGGSGG